MKIFNSTQIHELDRYTIEHEGIKSIDLMERAASALTNEITSRWDPYTPMIAFAGPGNNGGDALAVTRMLLNKGYDVTVYLFNVKSPSTPSTNSGTAVTGLSADCAENRQRLLKKYPKALIEITKDFEPPKLTADTLVIDGLFGSGLNKPLGGGFAAMAQYINKSQATVVSIDLPSGLMTDDNTYNVRSCIVKADLTLTLDSKKLCMMLADNQQYLGQTVVLDINLSKEYKTLTDTSYSIIEEEDVRRLMTSHGDVNKIDNSIRLRSDFAHKGSMGHALLIAGKYGMAGAAILSAKACLRTGAGKVTVHTPRKNNDILQISVPEAIIHPDRDDEIFSQTVNKGSYDAVGIGPGLGTADASAVALMAQIRNGSSGSNSSMGGSFPMVLDADALNILSSHKAWLQQLPEGIIYTPHPKELDRFYNANANANANAVSDFERLSKARDMAQRLHGYIILKGHYSALCMPDGQVVFNSTGNSGMATAGSGDVLTGVITALLARGYSAHDAAIVGMYLHGLAGDYAANKVGKESLIASDIIDNLPAAFLSLTHNR